MRKENIGTNNAQVELASVQRYHEGIWNEAYAFSGYEVNKYFTSDRYMTLDEAFKRQDGKPLKGFGLEIETECNSIVNKTVYANLLAKVVFKTFPSGLFKMQDDGSLGGRTSAECITQVMTKEFIRNHYKDFKTMWNEYFPAFGITTQNANCGMHVNLSVGLFGTTDKKQFEGCAKMYYLINKHYNFFVVALNRTNDTGYCGKCSDYDNAKSISNFRDLQGNNHGRSMNMSHYNVGRIEIRLVGGQKDFGCFRNTMETVFHLVEACKSLSWNDLDDLTKVFDGCNSYVYNRLSTNCLRSGVITSAQLEAIRPTVKEVQYL